MTPVREALDVDVLRSRLPVYVSDRANEIATEIIRDMEGETHDGGRWAIARWVEALSAAPGEPCGYLWRYKGQEEWQYCPKTHVPPYEAERQPLYTTPQPAAGWDDPPKRPFAFAVKRAPENGEDQWRLFMDEVAARAEAEQLDGEYEGLYRVGDRRSALTAQPAAGWTCLARKQSLPEPAECNWPDCGCDPHATKVIESLVEQGWIAPREAPAPADLSYVSQLIAENNELKNQLTARPDTAEARLREAVEDAIDTLESMDLHVDNPLYERLVKALDGGRDA